MEMLLNFGDPANLKTRKIVFEDVYGARDPGTLEQLKELSSKRRVIEESINKSSFLTEAIAREVSGGLTSRCEQDLQKLEQYLPLLENLVFHVDLVSNNRQMVQWTSDLKIQWSSALSSTSFFNLMGPRFYQINNLRFELGMTLFLYGAILRGRAFEVSQGDLVKAVTIFRKAAGVYRYLAEVVLTFLQPALTAEKPPEAVSSVSTAMSLICLAEAQAVTIKKAEEKGNAEGLLAKLHYGVTELLDEAFTVLHSTVGEYKDISMRFIDFISSSRDLHELRSKKYLAEALKVAGQIGAAIGVLHQALTKAKTKIPGEESWRLIFRQEIEGASDLLRKFESENDFVWREKIPQEDELPLPQGKKIVTSISYHPQRWERELVFKI
ncbi:BRO1 domain [Dillenia turbinata]|uniref:BRO1 domain n=1 Tax=Dillenia turbinata TaxID=194707 RepID=A0AAN8V162_9MAGN